MENPVTFKLTYGKKTYEITFESSSTIADLRKEVETVTGVHPHMQKLLFKGVLKDEQTLKDAKIKDGVKVMLMASKLEDVLQSITAPTTSAAAEAPTTKSVDKVAWCEKTEHKKIIDKGKPDDAEEDEHTAPRRNESMESERDQNTSDFQKRCGRVVDWNR
ncbi:Ubiquitin domain-containing protein ubfd1 [Quaeritorhiza haematococci]|nr:Ubiquitin domain-containing protein ubfd1 [Quaeritorhiza haematococci]